jgi:hypothetical protein
MRFPDFPFRSHKATSTGVERPDVSRNTPNPGSAFSFRLSLCLHPYDFGEFMAKPNYSHQKKQREQAAKKKREEKQQRRQQRKEEPPATPAT